VDSGHHHDEIAAFKNTMVTGVRSLLHACPCRVILVHDATVTNSWLGNCRLVDWTAMPDLGEGAWGMLPSFRTSRAPNITSQILVSVSSTHNTIIVEYLIKFYWYRQIFTWHRNWLKCSYLRVAGSMD